MKEKGKIAAIEQHVIDCVRKLRRHNGLRQRDLANILNTTPSFIGNVENEHNPAKYNLKHISMLAKHFELSPRFFLPESSLGGKNETFQEQN